MLLLFPSLSFISCLAISACLTPTDPVISAAIIGKRFTILFSRKNVGELDCSTVVGGKYAHQHVPVNLRQIIAAESAANDGLAYPFLSISIYLTIEASRREAFAKWFLVGWLCKCSSLLTVHFELTLSRSQTRSSLAPCSALWLVSDWLLDRAGGFPVSDDSVGYGFRKILRFSHDRGLADRESFVAQYLALALFTIGVASSLGMDDLLAAFAAGTWGSPSPTTRIDPSGFCRHGCILGR
jgi:NhaP-type Na+/H+ or K+/H+ antiporter